MTSNSSPFLASLTAGRIPPTVALSLAAIAVAVAWAEPVHHLITVWLNSTTYRHGLIVLPSAMFLVWLGWRNNEQFAPWPLALAPLALAGVLMLIGRNSDLRVLQHTAIALSLGSLVTLFLGRSFAIRHRFALIFLVFLIPVGDQLLPTLQILTGQGIMIACALFDVPAIRDGTIIRTDAGDFIVEEGCAGLRFLVASVVVGFLAAHLFFRTRWKQLTFLAAAFFIPVIANIIRASTVVLVATWSDLRYATGFDHIVYGWGLFSIIMGLIVALGFAFSEDKAPAHPSPPLAVPANVSIALVAVSLFIILLSGWA